MSNTDIALFYNTYRLDALERILTESGSSVETELLHELDALYKHLVPEDEQSAIEARIERETAVEEAAREAARRFAVIRFHGNGNDFLFTSDWQNSFYSAAHLYRTRIKDEVGRNTIDSLARHFGDYQVIDGSTFSALCDAMSKDPRITALVDFDFDRGTVSVCESSDNAWWTYSLKDVSTAVYRAERKMGLRLEKRQEIFSEDLVGKEIVMDEPSETSVEDPVMRM